jgi:hypothetical protein
VEHEREALQVRIERAAQVVDHAVPDRDRQRVVGEGRAAENDLDGDDRERGEREKLERLSQRRDPAGRGDVAQDVIDHDLERPWLQKLEPGGHGHQRHGEQEQPAVRINVGQDPSRRLAADHGLLRPARRFAPASG